MRSEACVRRVTLAALAAVAASCTFPEHTFDDDRFYGTGAQDGGGGTSGTGGGTSGTGGGGGSCAGQCAPVPGGWEGPVAVFLGAAAGTAPDCGGDYATNRLNGSTDLDPGAASCSPCSCGPAASSSCVYPVVNLWKEVGCGSGDSLQLTPPGSAGPGACLFVDLASQPGFTVAGVSAALPGGTADCPVAAGSGEITKATPSFATRARACALPGSPSSAGCGSDVCVPALPAGFTNLCVLQAGDVPCAGSTFVDRHVVYGGFDDQRACAQCSCAGTCGGSLGVWSNAGCLGNAEGTVSAFGAGTCTNVAHSTQKSIRYTAGATCAPSGGELTGAATGTGPTTLCCL
ncbi:MAG: hypothetical protein IT376_06550 [Polyangiaceae bacterium]|nr:hypothetical protein [Polyangiaceae bacterium]